MELSIKSFDQICRACLCTSNNMKSLFTKIEGEKHKLLDLFVLVANLDASTEDEMPKQVCGECELILYKHDEFRKRCLVSDDLLKKVLSDSIQFDAITIETCSDADFELQEFDKKEFGESNESFTCNDANKNNSVKTESYENSQDLEDHFDEAEALGMLPYYDQPTKQSKAKTTQKKSQKNKVSSSQTQKKTEINDPVKYEYSCQLCNLNFLDLPTFENHLETHKYMTEKRKYMTEKRKIQEEQSTQCTLCFRRCKTKKTLSKHMKLHAKKDHVKYSCDRCKREFKYKTFLESHVISVHMHNSYECNMCKETFKSKESLEVHMDSHTEKKHVCSVCGKSYKMLCTLKDHMRKHTGEKPFLCCTCGKGFSQKTNLAQHTRRHLGVKPFKCAICAKSFVSKGELEAHGRKHSGAHPFVCDDCGSGFTTSSALLKHRRTHTGERPYACDLCPLRFAASGTLKNHRRTHTGERPFQCSLCEKAFVQRTDLISHIRCHTGERPYICSECGQAFRKSAALKTHLKMHGKEVGVCKRPGCLEVCGGGLCPAVGQYRLKKNACRDH